MRALVKSLCLFAVLAGTIFYLASRFPEMVKGTDFPDFYAAARMVREGAGHQLYDVATQQQYQIRYAGRVGTYYIHPPFETLAYLPFVCWPMERAYLLWSLFNAALLVVAVRMMASHLALRWDWQLLAAATLIFVPVLLSFIQGQDSILLLFLLVLAVAALRREQQMLAGLLFACGLFKFHLVVPIVVVLLGGKRWKMLGGFAATAALLALLSGAVSGWGWFTAYGRFLANLSALPMAGVHPEEMANLRGVIVLLFPSASLPLIVISSLAILALAVRASQQVGIDLGFANAVVASTLVSYHLSPHDLTIVLLPVVLDLGRAAEAPRWLRWTEMAIIAVLYLPPLHVSLLSRHRYGYVGIVTLALFMAMNVGRSQAQDGPLRAGA